MPNLVWTDLPDGQCDWLSSQWGQYTGIPEQELLGLNWLDRVLHPDDRERTLASWQAACADQADYDLEYRIRRHDGEYRWFKTRGVPIRDEQGKIIYWFGTCTDIEDVKRSEERERVLLERSVAATAKFEAVFNQSGIFAGIMDVAGHLREVNDLAVQWCGYTRDEVLNRPFWDTPWWRGSNEVQARIRAAVLEARSGNVFRDTLRYWVADGSERFVDFALHPIRDPFGNVIFLHPTGIDITDRRRAEIATHRQSEQLRRLADIATRLNVAADIATITRVVTEEARTLVGAHQAVTRFTIDQNWGQAINSVSLSDKYGSFLGYDERPDGSGIYSLVCRMNRPMRLTQAELEAHPAYKWFGKHASDHPPLRGWLAAPLVGRNGRNLGLIQLSDKIEGEFTAEDEVILVQLAQMAAVAVENARLVQDLRDGDRRKDEFLATLAHELRNPLAPIRNGLQIMRLSGGDRQAMEQVRTMMDRQLSHMVHLVDDLLDLSRISRGKIELRTERVELAKIVQHAVDTSRPAIEQAGHDLTVTMPPGPIYVDADTTRLSQVFANLLNNAAKYTERGGQVHLSVRRDDGHTVVSVKDNGVGIPTNMLPHVFEMFTQVGRHLERSQGGLGIGLSIVKRLVAMHGGTVEAFSDGQGTGSEFIVRLPVVATPASVDGDSNGEARKPVPSRRILVVDDNRDAATSLAMMLQMMGHETRTAHDGLEALEIAAAFRPEIILLDIGMPRLNGYDAARHIREQAWGQSVLLVALTGWGQDEDRRRSREAGFDSHMTKPVDLAELEKLLAERQID